MPTNPSNPILNYRGKDMTPRPPFFRLLSKPARIDIFYLIRATLLTFTILMLLTGGIAFRFVRVWYAEISQEGLTLMVLDSNYADRLPAFAFYDRPQFVRIILSQPHWPYAHRITIPAWLALPFWITFFLFIWRLTRFPVRR